VFLHRCQRKVSSLDKTTGRTVVLRILTSMFSHSRQENKRQEMDGKKIPWRWPCWMTTLMQFWSFSIVTKCFNFPDFQRIYYLLLCCYFPQYSADTKPHTYKHKSSLPFPVHQYSLLVTNRLSLSFIILLPIFSDTLSPILTRS
jgi:hypothetical protein